MKCWFHRWVWQWEYKWLTPRHLEEKSASTCRRCGESYTYTEISEIPPPTVGTRIP